MNSDDTDVTDALEAADDFYPGFLDMNEMDALIQSELWYLRPEYEKHLPNPVRESVKGDVATPIAGVILVALVISLG